MKTFEEVELHLQTTGYKTEGIDKICGYLIGVGLKAPSVEVKILIGTGTFEEFYAWFNDEAATEEDETDCCCPSCILCGIMRDIEERMNHAVTVGEKSYFAQQLEFLITEFGLDEEDSE